MKHGQHTFQHYENHHTKVASTYELELSWLLLVLYVCDRMRRVVIAGGIGPFCKIKGDSYRFLLFVVELAQWNDDSVAKLQSQPRPQPPVSYTHLTLPTNREV